MGVLKAWLGVALALAEFAVLPHCEGKKEWNPVCVRPCSLRDSFGFSAVGCWGGSFDLRREVDTEWILLSAEIPTPGFSCGQISARPRPPLCF